VRSKVARDEVAAAISYYNKYFDDAGVENEQKVIEELGSPTQIAARIKAESAVKELEQPAPSVKKGISAIWWVILAIFAAPIALPIAIACAAVAIGLVLAALGIIIALIVTVATVFGSGILIVIAGFAVIATSIPASIFTVGVGLAILGATILIGIFIVLAARGIFSGIAKLMNKQLQKKSKGDDIRE